MAPLPLEQTDPDLAAHLLGIVQQSHPVRSLHVGIGFRWFLLRDGREMVSRTQRNAACPCGSGLKFKHCHGKK